MTSTSDSTTQHIELSVEGMSCASCVGRVQRALEKNPDVVKATVNLTTERAYIELNPTAQIDAQGLTQILDKAGYPAQVIEKSSSTQLQLSVENMSCASCVGRVQRVLEKIEGVTQAHVNLATERADVTLNKIIDSATILDTLEQAGYPATLIVQQSHQNSLDEKRQQEAKTLYKELILAAILALPVFILEMGSHLIPNFHTWIAQHIGIQNSWYIQFVLATLVLLFAGQRFYRLGIPALLRGAPDMNSLVAVGTLAAYSYSIVATFSPNLLPAESIAVYFESAVVIIVLILFGRYLEVKAKGRTTQAIQHLLALQPKIAHRQQGQQYIDVPISALQVNDIVLIKPGEKIPTDGIILDGSSHVDESMMTGEAQAMRKTKNDQVIGGTVNQQGSLIVQTTAIGEQTLLAQIVNLVEQAQGSKLPIQTMVDKVTLWFVPAVMVIAILTFVLWLFLAPQAGLNLALVNAVAVLIIACPCAMGLATPTSIMVGTGRAAELGVLFRQGDALQQLKEAKVIAFDKTGTLTLGKPKLTDFIADKASEHDTLLSYAASLESQSEHPIAHAVVEAAQEQNLPLLSVKNFQAIVGEGIQATIDKDTVYIGAQRFMQSLQLSCEDFLTQAAQLADAGKTPVFLAVNQKVRAVFAVSDPLKKDSIQAIKVLHQLGLKTAMISGDNQRTAEYIARQLAIDTVIAEVLPHEKVTALTKLQQQYGTVAFVGDGINDAPALAAADIGIAIGTGTDIAIETADVVLMSGSIQGVVNAVALSQATIKNIQQNLFWAFAYNVALIPIAAGILYPFNGTLLSPMFAAAAMALSSIFVLSNALRLKRFQIST